MPQKRHALAATDDLPLRQDEQLLDAWLQQMLEEIAPVGVATVVAQARELASVARQAQRGAAGEADPVAQAAQQALATLLLPLPAEQAAEVIRAFSQHFALSNLAERVHRIRRHRLAQAAGAMPKRGSLMQVCQRLAQQGHKRAAVEALLAEVSLSPVFTAHPTEPTRRSLLRKEQRMASHLLALAELPEASRARARAVAALRSEMAGTWQTEEYASAPSIRDEAEHVIFYLTTSLYDVVPEYAANLADALDAAFGANAKEPARQRPPIRFGTWVGGDMDGNPNAGAQTILQTLRLQRTRLLACYARDIDALIDVLSQSATRVQTSAALQDRLLQYAPYLGVDVLPERHRQMPYRRLLHAVQHRLRATAAISDTSDAAAYTDGEALAEDLAIAWQSLCEHGGAQAGAWQLQRLLRRVECFGLHLATLDVRQDALQHRQAVAALLQQPELQDAAAGQRETAYLRALQQPPTALVAAAQSAAAATCLPVVQVMDAIAYAHAHFGAAAIGLYIISMAERVDDVLAVLLLARASALGSNATVPLDIAPLFETVPDLARAAQTLDALLAEPTYRAHVRQRGNVQHVMLGYSDSNKESGIVASRCAVEEAQRALLVVAARHDVSLALFHGRGGTASRGGSKPREAILAAAPGTLSHGMRLTEQGEIIHSKYGLQDIAARTLELMGGALLQARLQGDADGADAEAQAIVAVMQSHGRAHYRALVVDEEDFFAYFQAATPIDVIARLRIGSRPASRRTQRGITDLRAIPWVFAWTQNRQMLPGWFGLGTAIEAAEAAFGTEAVQAAVGRWRFLQNMLTDAEMVLAKVCLRTGARYAALAPELAERFCPRIVAEHKRSVAAVLRLRGRQVLLADEPILARAIALRNPAIDPMSMLQLHYLPLWRQSGREDTATEQLLLHSVRGIARGMQNTG